MSNSIKVLLVEDDHNLGQLLKTYLDGKGCTTTWAQDGEEGYSAFGADLFDIILMDVMMPVKDGFTLAKEIRETDDKTPLVFLTAKSLKEDVLEGFSVGADDYITKPFTMEVLFAKIEAILRRTGEDSRPEDNVFSLGKFSFDYNHQKLVLANEEQKLTTKESELLLLLVRNKNQLLERSSALKKVWGDDSYYNGRSMDVYIAKLRKYLSADQDIEIINVHGQGFKMLVGE